MKKEEFTEFENNLIDTMNKRAMLLVKLEEYLKYHKIPIDKKLVDSMSDDGLNELVETWSPRQQKKLRKSFKFETEIQTGHIINDSKGEDKVS